MQKVLQTSSCPKTKLTGVQEFWWALVDAKFIECRVQSLTNKVRLKRLFNLVENC